MRRYAAFLLCFTLLFGGASVAYAENDTDEFDYSSVIVVTKPVNNIIGMLSLSSPFGDLEIAKIKNLDNPSATNISPFGLSGSQTLKLTLENPGRENVLEAVEKLNSLPNIEFAEPNYTYTLFGMPNDPHYTSGAQYSLNKISAPAVWAQDIDCSNVVIAAIDSGFDMDHPDLVGNIWTNPGEIPDNGKDDDGNGYIDDVHGWDFFDDDNDPDDEYFHGTHVAGILSAVTDNSEGVASLARNVKIVPLKIFNEKGKTNTDHVYEALQYVKKMGFTIVNNSYGSKSKSDLLYGAMKDYPDALFLAASGNSTEDNDSAPMYPASYGLPNIISVASTDIYDNLSDFTNYGAQSVNIAAPGSDIVSTYIGGIYASVSGTSMACPLVASAAAVIKAVYPDLTPTEIIERLEDSADKLDSLDGKIKTGARLNAYRAVMGDATPIPSPTQSPSPTPTHSPIPTSSPTPVPSPTPTADPSQELIVDPDNSVTVSRVENTVGIELDIPDADDDEIVVFAAMWKNGALERVVLSEVANSAAEVIIPEGLEDAEIMIYIWDKQMHPYTAAIPAIK